MYRIGFVPGVFDLRSTAQIDILRHAKGQCEILIAGVASDDLLAVIRSGQVTRPFNERFEIACSLRDVDAAFPLMTLNGLDLWRAVRFDVLLLDAGEVIFSLNEKMKRDLNAAGADVVDLTSARQSAVTQTSGTFASSEQAIRAKHPHIRAVEGWWP